jgi:hypothetical protein
VRVEPKLDSTFDFLYVDQKRIALLLSQFDDSGLLQSVEQSEGVSESAETIGQREAGLSLAAVKGKFGSEKRAAEGQTQSAKRTYDPQWTNALTLLDFLDERGVLHRDLKSVRVGQIACIPGSLSIINGGIIKTIMASPAVREGLITQEVTRMQRQYQRSLVRGGNALMPVPPAPDPVAIRMNANSNLDTMLALPAVVYGRTIIDENMLWYTIDETGLVGSVADIMLKHSTQVSGEWTVIGIIDGLPDQFAPLTMADFVTTDSRN